MRFKEMMRRILYIFVFVIVFWGGNKIGKILTKFSNKKYLKKYSKED